MTEIKSAALELGTERIRKLLVQYAVPAIIAMTASSLYNMVDSIFIGHGVGPLAISGLALTFPLMNLAAAFGSLVGVGAATLISMRLGQRDYETAQRVLGNVLVLNLIIGIAFGLAALLFLDPILYFFGASEATIGYAREYMTVILLGNVVTHMYLGLNSVLRASGHPRKSMYATINTVVINTILDPLFIFGFGWGIRGAAIATVVGQCVAAVITGISGFRRPPKPVVMRKYVRQIYRLGYPSIFMQMLYTVYIMALNMILAGFSDDAVTVLGLYYKLQSFFFIPLNGLQTCIVPILSYNFACLAYDRCKRILYDSCGISLVFMLVGVVSFECIPGRLIGLFSQDPAVLAIGVPAFRIIGLSFIPAVLSLLPPVFFQAIGAAGPSLLLSVVRQICCLIPLFWIFSKISLEATWFAYPLSEVITGSLGVAFYLRQLQRWRREAPMAGPTVR